MAVKWPILKDEIQSSLCTYLTVKKKSTRKVFYSLDLSRFNFVG